jgi:hypothetical protein
MHQTSTDEENNKNSVHIWSALTPHTVLEIVWTFVWRLLLPFEILPRDTISLHVVINFMSLLPLQPAVRGLCRWNFSSTVRRRWMNFVAIYHMTKYLVKILKKGPTPIRTSSTIFHNDKRRSSHANLTCLDNLINVFFIQAPLTSLKQNRGIPHFINCRFV